VRVRLRVRVGVRVGVGVRVRVRVRHLRDGIGLVLALGGLDGLLLGTVLVLLLRVGQLLLRDRQAAAGW
jgi:hypothetical protein